MQIPPSDFLELAQIHSCLLGQFWRTQSAKMENTAQSHQITSYVHSWQISLQSGCSTQFPVLQISKPVQLLSRTVQTHKAAGNNFMYFNTHCWRININLADQHGEEGQKRKKGRGRRSVQKVIAWQAWHFFFGCLFYLLHGFLSISVYWKCKWTQNGAIQEEIWWCMTYWFPT